jgi:hypothetical protein
MLQRVDSVTRTLLMPRSKAKAPRLSQLPLTRLTPNMNRPSVLQRDECVETNMTKLFVDYNVQTRAE